MAVKKQSLMTNKNYYHSNEAVKKLEEDLYNYSPYAQKVQEAIKNSGFTDEPLIFGLYGKWGEGKTSFLNLIFKTLESNQKEEAKQIIKFTFNPWRYQTEDKLLFEFFEGLIKVIKNDYRGKGKNAIIRKLKKYASSILSGASIGIDLGIIKATYAFKHPIDKFSIINKKSLEKQKEEIDILLSKYKFRIVIFIDDIDRLSKKEIYKVFRLVKLTASFKNITYVLSFDKDMVAKAIYENYGDNEEDGHLYIEKIVNIPLKLPKVDDYKILEALKNGLAVVLEKNKIVIDPAVHTESSHTYSTGVNRFYFEVEGMEKFIDTPRELVRLLNTFSVDLIALKDEVNYSDLLWLELIKVKYPQVYDFIKNNPSYFISNGSTIYAVQDEMGKNYSEELNSFLSSNKYSEGTIDKINEIVFRLFPYKTEDLLFSFSKKEGDVKKVKNDSNLSKIERRINHEDFFDVFFSFHTIGKVSHIALDKLIEMLNNKGNNFEELASFFDQIIKANDKDNLGYELIERLKNLEDLETKENFIKLLLNNVDKLSDNVKKNIFSATSKQKLIQDIFENVSFLEEEKQIEIFDQFIDDVDISEIFYIRRGLTHDKFKGTKVQKHIDSILIKMVEERYHDKSFFDDFDKYIPRFILSIWQEQNPKELRQYLEQILNSSNIISFLKSFPPEWTGVDGGYLDDFGSDEYRSLKTFLNPKKVFDIIKEFFPDLIKRYDLEKEKLWGKREDREDEYLLLQFLHWYYKDGDNDSFPPQKSKE